MNLSKKSNEEEIQSIFLKWYKKNKRDLPWRSLQSNKLPNPYYIFVSEYMLQQTTVNTVKNRFDEFILRWPTLDLFSTISSTSILSFWSGLGYYSRATNLLKAAKFIKKNFIYALERNIEIVYFTPRESLSHPLGRAAFLNKLNASISN